MSINIYSTSYVVQVQEEEEEEDDDDDDTEEEDEEEEYIPLVRNPTPPPISPVPIVIVEEDEEEEGEDEDEEEGEGEENETNSRNMEPRSEGGEKGRVEGDPGSFLCPICMDPWSSEGAHRTCCLPCGHVYGRSCIERWTRESRKTPGRCPQCKRKYKLTELRNIYPPRLTVVTEDLQKEVFSLREENELLKMKNTCLQEEVRLHKKREMDCELHEKQKVKRSSDMMPFEDFGERRGSQEQIQSARSTALHSSRSGSGYSCGSIALKAELAVEGARVFDMDVSSQILIICRRPSRMAGTHELTKISLSSLDENENISLPSGKKPIKDIRISLLSRRLALLASMEKTISIFSMETNNTVLSYNLPAPAWSCSWDLNNTHHAYAGLQNGMLTVLDLRQTREPVECINGLTSHPVHTIHSIVHNRDDSPSSASGRLLTASSHGVCQWNIGGVGERPYLIPGIENQGVCISLAYCDVSDDLVASFRPRLHVPNDIMPSQPSISPPPTVSRAATRGSHVLLKRVDEMSYQNRGFTLSNVSAVRMQKSTIVSKEGHRPLFVCGDEATNELCVRDLPTLGVIDHLKQHSHPILDLKYAGSIDTGLLGCVSEDRLQLFTCFEV
ncbi:hypothetical protein AAC387_Pa02g1437 [Persea americana]